MLVNVLGGRVLGGRKVVNGVARPHHLTRSSCDPLFCLAYISIESLIRIIVDS